MIRPLAEDDVEALQDLLEDCTEYAQRVTGYPTGPSDALSTLLQLPEGLPEDRKTVWGLWDGAALVGVADLLTGYPDVVTTTLGLLLVRPGSRLHGVGRRLHDAVADPARRMRVGIVDTTATGAEPFFLGSATGRRAMPCPSGTTTWREQSGIGPARALEDDRMVSAQGYGEDSESGWGFGLHHVLLAIPAGSEDALRAFYVGVLGMAEVTKPPALAARGGLWVRADALELHLGVEEGFRPARKAHPGIRVTDLDALAAHLEAHGIEVAWDTSLFPGHRRFYVADPVGNRLELIQRDETIPTW